MAIGIKNGNKVAVHVTEFEDINEIYNENGQIVTKMYYKPKNIIKTYDTLKSFRANEKGVTSHHMVLHRKCWVQEIMSLIASNMQKNSQLS